jgi:hypothetical protein
MPASTLHAALQENDELLHHLRLMRAAAKETMADVNVGAVASTQDISTYLRPGNSEISIGIFCHATRFFHSLAYQ